jgi:putative DNA primase/helicase
MNTIKMPDFRRIEGSASRVDAAIKERAAPEPACDDGVILLQASTMTPEPVRWLWHQWLALGKFHVLAGPPGQGKTTIALACMATVSAGGRWPDGSRCAAGNVLIWSGEDDPKDTLLPRLIAMGADTSRVYFIEGTRIDGKAEAFDPARDMPALLTRAARIGDVRLLIVDPVVSAVAGDSHKNGEVRRALQPLVDLASALDAAILGISHFSKGTGGRDPVERVTGSLAFGALARVVLCAVKVKGNEGDEARRILARAKSNIGPDDGGFEYGIEQTELEDYVGISASVITWGKALSGTARELLAEAETEPAEDEEATALDDACEFLQSELKAGPKPAKYLLTEARHAGHSERTIKRAKASLGAESRKNGSAWEWALTVKDAKGANKSGQETLAPLAPLPLLTPDTRAF